MTSPLPSEDMSFSSIMKPDPSTNTGPALFEVNRNWKKELAQKSGLLARLKSVGEEMVHEMEGIVPRATGALADSLYSRVVQGRNEHGQFSDAALQVGASADYALSVEFGHHVANSEEVVEAQPFIRPVVMRKRELK